MKKLFFGILLGIAILLAFFYFKGSKYIKTIGVKTEETGTRLEKVEKKVRESAGEAKETIKEKFEETKEKAADTKEKVEKFMK